MQESNGTCHNLYRLKSEVCFIKSMRKKKQAEVATEVGRGQEEAALAEIEAALDAGKAPRGGKALKEASRRLKADGRPDAASRALLLLSRLERRRGGDAAAIAHGRSALRLARSAKAGPEVDAGLDLLARLYSGTGDYPQARRYAGERLSRARAAGDKAGEAEALARLALVSWAAGEPGEALNRLDEARGLSSNGPREGCLSADLLRAAFLAQSGCPAAAAELLTRLLRKPGTEAQQLNALLLRGWALLCQGRPDAAARDFRRARRSAQERQDRVHELQAAAALAVAELHRESATGASARRTRAEALLQRTARTSRRLGHPELIRAVDRLSASLNGGAPALTPKEAAQKLVALAKSTDSVSAADASVREVERLARLPAGQPAYHCDLRLPFTLE
jgi:tetratricopeptide (TPR) repeat protein